MTNFAPNHRIIKVENLVKKSPILLLILDVVEALKLVRIKRANKPSHRSLAIGSAAWALTE